MKLSLLSKAVIAIPFLLSETNNVSAQYRFKSIAQVKTVSSNTPTFQITEIISDRDSIPEPEVSAYYKAGDKRNFYITHNNDGTFSLAYEDVVKNPPFPRGQNNQMVGIVDAVNIGYPGVFEIYSHKTADYYVQYNPNARSSVPLLQIYNNVDPVFAKNVVAGIKEFPEEILKVLEKYNRRLIISADTKVFYDYFPSARNQDLFKNQNKTEQIWIDGGRVDNRKWSEVGGLYDSNVKAVFLPQKYYYDERRGIVIDHKDCNEIMTYTLFHELFHGLDDVYNFSRDKRFIEIYNADKSKFTDVHKRTLGYFYKSEGETFAELGTALLGKMDYRPKALIMFKAFPKTADFIRDDVLPRFDVSMTWDEVYKKCGLREIDVKGARLEDIYASPFLPRLVLDMPLNYRKLFNARTLLLSRQEVF